MYVCVCVFAFRKQLSSVSIFTAQCHFTRLQVVAGASTTTYLGTSWRSALCAPWQPYQLTPFTFAATISALCHIHFSAPFFLLFFFVIFLSYLVLFCGANRICMNSQAHMFTCIFVCVCTYIEDCCECCVWLLSHCHYFLWLEIANFRLVLFRLLLYLLSKRQANKFCWFLL